MGDFEPKIVGFLCKWCLCTNLANIAGMKWCSNGETTSILCYCKVNECSVLRAFVGGADGILVGGCLGEECSFVKDSLCSMKRVTALKPLLEAIGIGSERLRIEWISASENTKLAEMVKDFTQMVKQLGPSPINKTKR